MYFEWVLGGLAQSAQCKVGSKVWRLSRYGWIGHVGFEGNCLGSVRESACLAAAERRRATAWQFAGTGRVSVGVSSGTSQRDRGSAVAKLRSGKPLHDFHGAAAVRTLPKS